MWESTAVERQSSERGGGGAGGAANSRRMSGDAGDAGDASGKPANAAGDSPRDAAGKPASTTGDAPRDGGVAGGGVRGLNAEPVRRWRGEMTGREPLKRRRSDDVTGGVAGAPPPPPPAPGLLPLADLGDWGSGHDALRPRTGSGMRWSVSAAARGGHDSPPWVSRGGRAVWGTGRDVREGQRRGKHMHGGRGAAGAGGGRQRAKPRTGRGRVAGRWPAGWGAARGETCVWRRRDEEGLEQGKRRPGEGETRGESGGMGRSRESRGEGRERGRGRRGRAMWTTRTGGVGLGAAEDRPGCWEERCDGRRRGGAS